MFIKVDGGITKPFITTTGFKQGCVFSPLLFNLYINKLPSVYDEQCDPVYIGSKPVHCLMWADDCVVMSTTETGLQRSINKTVEHFTKLGLTVNKKKTKCVIFNPSGWGPSRFPKIKFHIDNQLLENVDHYTYLGVMFKPSGSVDMAVKELLVKANRAYFSLSSLLYENKKMKIDRSVELFDSLVTPVSLYASQFWSVLSLPASAFSSAQSLMKAWEVFIPETVNQRFCRLILSLHKKTSRLAVLGELARYPLLINSLIQSLKYKWTICNKSDKDSIVYLAVREMEQYSAQKIDCWLYRVQQVESLCNIKSFPSYTKTDIVKNNIKKSLKSIFDRFYIDQINEQKIGNDSINHNKLRLYATVKGSFTREPYLDLVQSRNQRAWLSRLRCSGHHLEIEQGRWSKTPIAERLCKTCDSGKIGDEFHAVMSCKTFNVKRACFIGKMDSILPGFKDISKKDQFKMILCPTNPAAAKVTNQFLRILFLARDKILDGSNIDDLSYPTVPVSECQCNFDYLSDVEDEWESFESVLDDSIT